MTAYKYCISKNGINLERDSFRFLSGPQDCDEDKNDITFETHRFNLEEVFSSIREDLKDEPDFCEIYYRSYVYPKVVDHIFNFCTMFRDQHTNFYIGLEDSKNDSTTVSCNIDIRLYWTGKEDDKAALLDSLKNQTIVVYDDEEPHVFGDERLSIHVSAVEDSTIFTLNSIYNGHKTFYTDECVVCMDNHPNVLYCNCGHISTCGYLDLYIIALYVRRIVTLLE